MFSPRNVCKGTLKIPSGYNKTLHRLAEKLLLLSFKCKSVLKSFSANVPCDRHICWELHRQGTIFLCWSSSLSVTETDQKTHFANIWSPETRLHTDRPLSLLLNPIWKYSYSIKVTALALSVWLLLKLRLYIWRFFLQNTADALATTR
jgi:hypothetical protein